MAQCTVCGTKAGAFKDVCQSCDDELRAREASAKKQALEAEKAKVAEKTKKWQESFADEVAKGVAAFAYKAVYVPIDSVVNNETLGEFNIAALQQLGLWGWQVVGVMPRTVGLGLKNVSYGTGGTSETWGAGIGGNVTGVYVLLSKAVVAEDKDSIEQAIHIGQDLIASGLKL